MSAERPVRSGDAILSGSWNRLLERLTRIEGVLGIGLNGADLAAAFACPVPFRYKSSDGDVLICRLYIDITEGTEDIYVAKQYLLRPSIAARGGYTYAYSDDFTRVSTKTADASTENQVVTPSYEVDDIIYAMRCPYYTGVLYDPLGGAALAPVEWLEVEAGRQWSEESA